MSGPAGPRRVAVSGAGGFVGAALVPHLTATGWQVHRLVRRRAGPGEIEWDPLTGAVDGDRLEGFTALVNLAGESIAGVWTPAKKRRILESRVRGTRALAEAAARLDHPPGIFLSASGVGYYGDGGEAVLTESNPPGEDFLAKVCLAWEAATQPAADRGIRVVAARFGLVLDASGGVLRLMLPFFRFGLGARLGSGEQWTSWIARSDLVRVIGFALDTDLAGPVNAVAPEPVRNADFTRAVAAALGRPAFMAVPAAALRAFSGGMADALLLASQRALPTLLLERGFVFEHPRLEGFVRIGVDGND
jgi:uncharacterized protein